MTNDTMTLDGLPVLDALGTAEFHNNPKAFYARMHTAGGPALYQHPSGDGLVLTAYSKLQNALKHPSMQAQIRTARASGPSAGGAVALMFDAHPVFMNEPRHRPVRLAATAAIGLNREDWIIEQINEIAADLIATLKKQGGGDLVGGFAFALSSRMWGRILGLPDSAAQHLLCAARNLALPLQFAPGAQDLQLANEGAAALIELIADRSRGEELHNKTLLLIRQSLQENPDPDASIDALDLLTSLTFDAIDGAGGMTSNFLHCLMTYCDAGNSLRQNMGNIGSHWIEAARLYPPLLGLFRCPIEDVEIDGMCLKKGVNVLTLNAAGNRDPRQFAEPDLFDATREPNRQLSFGFGHADASGVTWPASRRRLVSQCYLMRLTKSYPRLRNPTGASPAYFAQSSG